MAGESVNGWDSRVLAASESSFGTTPNPAAAQVLETISCKMGPAQVGQTRAKRDRNLGRGMQAGWVEGRVMPIPFSIETSVKTRADADDVPAESVLYKAAGLTQSINSGTNVNYAMSSSPLSDGAFSALSLYRAFGANLYRYEAEQLRGGVIKSLAWSGGDKELTLQASGDAVGKYHLGYSASVTLADGSGTSLQFASAEEGYRFALGWYQIENEIVKITAMDYATYTATLLRAQLSSSGAAHSGAPMYPYLPALTYGAQVPISEANCTVTVDSQAIRCLSFTVNVGTGLDLLPGETGSAFIQGPKAVRYTAGAKLRLVLSREHVALLGKAKYRNSVAVAIVCATPAATAGKTVTFNMPYAEVRPFEVPDTANDVAIVDVDIEARDSAAGNDMFTLYYT